MVLKGMFGGHSFVDDPLTDKKSVFLDDHVPLVDLIKLWFQYDEAQVHKVASS